MASPPTFTADIYIYISLSLHRAPEAHGAGWSKIWDAGKSDLWDRGQASPALVDIVEKHQRPGELFHPFAADGRRKRVLVPGCGRGYDVVMLALHGFDAYGLDISATGVAAAEAFASKELQNPSAANFGPNHDNKEFQSPGNVKFLEGNFFASEWENEAGGEFDLVYDYTFLCALHPTMRKNWAARMASLLDKDGLLTCLEFPMYKDRTLPGPPWGLNGALERRATDMLSVYQRK
ncbi:hypothetical protein SI65_08163 [Aspergillus cristatus]|uniref:S-adenosyl-L-methionine-dependent methyltransferase n=1 Tax=Aspergillus cristatus TaxID=573508 RepID=A0A1E3B8A9_ASPCR|nr:hypothetical protein SI65_08163 [Aspergillus cristatus]